MMLEDGVQFFWPGEIQLRFEIISKMFAKKAPRGRAKKKKLVIKGFAEDLSVRPMDFEEQAWVKLRSAIVAVQTSTAVDISREELYAVRRAASC